MDDATRDNINLKREFNRFITRFFYSKERTVNNLAELYHLIDDLIVYLNVEQTKIGNEMLDNGFTKEYIVNKDMKIFLDEELQCILIDKMTANEKANIVIQHNIDQRNKKE